jgi:hypothetical protein
LKGGVIMMEVEITLLNGANSIIIKSKGRAFLTTKDAVIFNRDMLTQIIVTLLQKDYIDHRIIEGVLEDIHTI